MKADSASPFSATNTTPISAVAQVETEMASQSPSSINGPVLGMALMASISLPLVCMAALRLRESQFTLPSQGTQAAVTAAGRSATIHLLELQFPGSAATGSNE